MCHPAGSSAGCEEPRRHARAAGPLAFPFRPNCDLVSLRPFLQSGNWNGGNEFKYGGARGRLLGGLSIRKACCSIVLHTNGVKSQILGQRRQEGAHREPSLSGTQSYPCWHLSQLFERLAVLDTWQQLDALIRM